jgi:aminoglycoside 3-N-acetyltransferase I
MKGQIPNDDYLIRRFSNNDFMVFMARIEDKVVGGLTIYILQSYYSAKLTAYICDIGIASGFQGQGLGTALITDACNYCKLSGFENAYVEAEGDDMEAIGFYRKTRFSHEMNATHFTYLF